MSQKLFINEKLENELRQLTEQEKSLLEWSIKRDGVKSPILYWTNPENGRSEIIDGHNRYRIAQKMKADDPKDMKADYVTDEVTFTHQTIAAVQYWMHKTQAARRGGTVDTNRMAELLEIIKKEKGEPAKYIVATVAKDADVSERTVRDRLAKVEVKAKANVLEQIVKLISKLSDDEKEALKEMIK